MLNAFVGAMTIVGVGLIPGSVSGMPGGAEPEPTDPADVANPGRRILPSLFGFGPVRRDPGAGPAHTPSHEPGAQIGPDAEPLRDAEPFPSG